MNSGHSMNRRKSRQVLDCGDGACVVAALDWKPTRSDQASAFNPSQAKAVNRFALHRSPRFFLPRQKLQVTFLQIPAIRGTQ